jgi:hypothetical protein
MKKIFPLLLAAFMIQACNSNDVSPETGDNNNEPVTQNDYDRGFEAAEKLYKTAFEKRDSINAAHYKKIITEQEEELKNARADRERSDSTTMKFIDAASKLCVELQKCNTARAKEFLELLEAEDALLNNQQLELNSGQ